MKLKIQNKLLLYILSTTIVIYAITLGFLNITLNRTLVNSAIKYTDEVAERYASITLASLNSSMDKTRIMVNAIKNIELYPTEVRDTIIGMMFYNTLLENEKFSGIFLSLELSFEDSTYLKPFGRRRITYFWNKGRILTSKDYRDLEGDNYSGPYYAIKSKMKESLTSPYMDAYAGDTTNKVLMSTLAVPIITNNTFRGMIGVDIPLYDFHNVIDEIRPFDGSSAFLVSNEGILVASGKGKELATKRLDSLYKEDNENFNLLDNIKNGNPISYFKTDSLGREYYVSIKPLFVGSSGTPWAIGIEVPVKTITLQAREIMFISIFVTLIGLIILTIIIWYIAKTISQPLVKTTQILEDLAYGDIDISKKIDVITKDEIGEISISVNKLIEGLNRTADFAGHIGQGDLTAEFTPLSKKDVFGKALLDMRKSLILAAEEDLKRKEEDKKQNWATEGQAKFGEILREFNNNMEDFSYNIISNLVKYIGANQGGLFVINDENKSDIFIELTASYAFDRRKILQKKIPMGVGLVGRCVQEGETIYMTNLPNDYLNITSGLGENNPNCLLIVPLKFNDLIYAVVELASFKEFEKYQIDFIEHIGQSIASTIATVKINIRTNRLLQELKIQSEELASQEEEMRQNMEEMQATQEELSRKANEFSNILDAIYSSSLVAEFDMHGRLININELFLRFIGKQKEEMIGRYQGSFSLETDDFDNFNKLWDQLKQGTPKKLVQHLKVNGKEYWLSETYTPILDEYGIPYKVINISVDISESFRNL